MKILYTTALGESMRDAFIEEASRLEPGKVLYIVPNQFFRRLVGRTGRVRTASIDDLPRSILEMSGCAEAVTVVSRYAQLELLKEAIQYLEAKGALPYFHSLAQKKGFRESLLSFLEELEKQRVTPEEWKETVLSWNRTGEERQKDLELTLLYTAYRSFLSQQGLCDLQDLYEAALRCLSGTELTLPWERLCFSEFNRLSGVQLALVDALAARCDISFSLFYDPKRPEISAATGRLEEALVGLGFTLKAMPAERQREADLAAFAAHWQDGSRAEGAPHLKLLEAPSAEAEMRGVLTAVKEKLQNGTPPGDIMILLRNMNDFPGFRRYFDEYGIAASLPDVTDMAGQPLCDFLTKLLEAAGARNDLEAWKALFRSPLAAQVWGVEREVFDAILYTRYIGSVDTLIRAVTGLESSHDVEPLLQFAAAPHTPGEWRDHLTGCLDAWELPRAWGSRYQKGLISLPQVRTMALTEKAVRDRLDRIETVFGQCGRGNAAVTPAEILEFWKDSLHGATLVVQPGDSEGIRVNEVSDVQGLELPCVFIMGMRDGLFPYMPRENWIYDDGERAVLASLGVPLTLAAQNLEQDRYFFASAFAMASHEVHLSWYTDDDAGPSCYVELLKRFYDAASLAVDKVRMSPEACASEAQLLDFLAEAPRVGEKEQNFLRERAGKDFFERKDSGSSRWQGASPFNGALDRDARELFLSATALDTYQACPFRYLVTYLWKFSVPEEVQAMPEPNVTGNLLHMTLAAFMGRHLNESLPALDPAVLKKELDEDFASVYRELERTGDIPVSLYSEHLKKRYLSTLQNWLRQEIAFQAKDPLAFRPWAVEKAFGRRGSEWGSLTVRAGGRTIHLSGQVDRIDSNGTEYAVIDYKTGHIPTKPEVEAGIVVQLPLYVKVVAEKAGIAEECLAGAQYGALKTGARRGGFWDAETKKRDKARNRTASKEQVMEQLDTVIAQAAEGIGRGSFPADPVSACPSYCPGRDICRYRDNPRRALEEEE